VICACDVIGFYALVFYVVRDVHEFNLRFVVQEKRSRNEVI